MKTLKEYIVEGLLDRVKNKEVDHTAVVKEFLEANYKFRRSYSIKEINNKLVVDVKGDIWVKNKDITLLTNRLFEFGTVSWDFKCNECRSLTSLEGAPKEVGRNFNCSECESLTTLEGAPKKVGGDFYCKNCKLLKTLEGAPKEVGGEFVCSYCNSLISLKGAPQKIGRDFVCSYCESLTSLEGAPKKVGGYFYCHRCDTQFTEDDVKKHTNVAGGIYT